MRVKPEKPPACSLCGREKKLQFHHLVPRALHRKRAVARTHARVDLAHHGIWVCRLCHHQIHRFFSSRELAESFHTPELLRVEPRMERFLRWARKQR